MADKIRVACAARRDPETVIIARTDARQSEGLAGAIDRAKAYGEAGADILFVEALTSEAEMREACDTLTLPTMANMANGGLTPMRTAAELQGHRLCGGDLPGDDEPDRGGRNGSGAHPPQGRRRR